ncbi:MAG: GtrA family protein [Prevotella sp.]|nr:GtrA family protein [Prevotella sp.]
MKKIAWLFRIRHEEKKVAWVVLAVLVALNAVYLYAYYNVFTPVCDDSWHVFSSKFCVSGFDPITYQVLTEWTTRYDVHRHPLLAFLMYPPFLLNQALTAITGINCAIFIVAVMFLFFAFYSFVFMYRICREVVGIARRDAVILSFMLFGFAHVMLSAVVPDHFLMSMFMLLLLTYLAGRKIKEGGRFTVLQSIVLFVFTAGISLSNGIKVFLVMLFTNGKRFFCPKYLLLAVIVPAALMWMFACWEYRKFVWPKEMARAEMKKQKAAEQKKKDFAAFADSSGIKDSVQLAKAFKIDQNKKMWAKYRSDHQKPWNKHTGKPIAKGEFMRWTDITTPRLPSVVENLFGESMQLHQDYLLSDTLRSRPVIVKYNWWINYVVEALVVLLFFAGVVAGRRSRFLWMVLACFAVDLGLHIGLGFGINEVYIMAAHWMYVLPLSMAWLFRLPESRRLSVLRLVVSMIVAWLWIYNGVLFVSYMLT